MPLGLLLLLFRKGLLISSFRNYGWLFISLKKTWKEVKYNLQGVFILQLYAFFLSFLWDCYFLHCTGHDMREMVSFSLMHLISFLGEISCLLGHFLPCKQAHSTIWLRKQVKKGLKRSERIPDTVNPLNQDLSWDLDLPLIVSFATCALCLILFS